MDLPPGKAIHYVDLTSDQVGANSITVDLTKPFTEKDLHSYHPHAHTMPPSTQQHIIQAHTVGQQHLQTIKQKYTSATHTSQAAWPFHFIPHTPDPTRSPKFSIDLTPIHKQYNTPPGKARYCNFTLNLLTRLHPAWATFLDKLIPIILACRILSHLTDMHLNSLSIIQYHQSLHHPSC